MAATTIARVFVAALVAVAPPSDLLPLTPADGWELTSREPGSAPADLSFAEYAELEPGSVAHLDPESDDVDGIVATVDVWSRADEEFLVTEIVRSPDEHLATSFVDQAAARAIASGLAAADPPFAGAWAYSGAVDGSWTRVVSWSQGSYAITLTHLTLDESDPAVIGALASTQAARVADVTGDPAGDAPLPEDPSPTPSGGGIPIGTVLIWVAGLAVAAWVVVRIVRYLGRSRRSSREPRDVDDIIAEARRARRPARERDGDADSDADHDVHDLDDIIARARRDARSEPERDD